MNKRTGRDSEKAMEKLLIVTINRYGDKISLDEYQKCIVKLYEFMPPMPTKKQEEMLQREALMYMIYLQLGKDFPPLRCQQLWEAQQKVQRKMWWSFIKYFILGYVLKGKFGYGDGAGLVKILNKEYSKVLDKQDMEDFFRDF